MSVDKIAGGTLIAVALGIGAAALAPGIVRAARPRLLKALATGIALAREGRVALEGAWEDLEDLLAEARANADSALETGARQPASSNVSQLARRAAEAEAESPSHGA
jgi:hypothetical protein